MLVLDPIKAVYMPVCKAATSSFIAYFGEVIYGSKNNAFKNPKERRKTLHNDFNVKWRPDSKFLETDKCKTYYKFAFVRSPWTRAVAAFRELLRRKPFGVNGANEERGLGYDEIYDLMYGHISFNNFINFIVNIETEHTDHINAHWAPQVEVIHIKTRAIRPMVYNFIGKLETVDQDFNHVQDKLGLQKTKLYTKHVTTKYDHKMYYQNSKIVDTVGDYYRDDIERFGYEYTP